MWLDVEMKNLNRKQAVRPRDTCQVGYSRNQGGLAPKSKMADVCGATDTHCGRSSMHQLRPRTPGFSE